MFLFGAEAEHALLSLLPEATEADFFVIDFCLK